MTEARVNQQINMETDPIKNEGCGSDEEDLVITHSDIPSPSREDVNCLTTSKTVNESANIFDKLNDMQAAMNCDDNGTTTDSQNPVESNDKNEVITNDTQMETLPSSTVNCESALCGTKKEQDDPDKPPILEREDDVIIKDTALGASLDNNLNCKAEIVTDSDGNKTYKCLLCNQTFNFYSNIARHRLRHTRQSNSLFKCWYCDKSFHKQVSLREHVRRVHGLPDVYECSACQRRFKYKGYLASHAFNCKGKFPYECLFCSKNLSTYEELTQHSLNHYTCLFCDNKYNDLYSLESHEKTHAAHEIDIEKISNPTEIDKKLTQNLKPLLQPVIKEYRSIAKISQNNNQRIQKDKSLPPCITDDWLSGLSATNSYKQKTVARIRARSRFYSNRNNMSASKPVQTFQNKFPNKSASLATNKPTVIPTTLNSTAIPNSNGSELTFLLITTDLNSGHILLQPLELVPPNLSVNDNSASQKPNRVVTPSTTSPINDKAQVIMNNYQKSIKPNIVGKRFSRPWNMTNILNIRLLTQVVKPNGIIVYACHCCLTEFSKVEELKHHDCNVPKRTTCRFCGMKVSRVSLMGHEHRHLGVRQFKCDMCYRGFTTDQILKRHIKDVHNSEFSYCAFCKAIFAKAANLENHLLECTKRNSITYGTIWQPAEASQNTIDLTDD